MDGFYLGIVFGGVKLKVYSVVELWEVYINMDISDLEKNRSDFPLLPPSEHLLRRGGLTQGVKGIQSGTQTLSVPESMPFSQGVNLASFVK